jgi:predicted amidohydrolase YtcJ
MTVLLLRGGEVEGRRADVLVEAGKVARIEPDLEPPRGHEVFDVRGGAVLPGLHDHHLHLLAMAAALRSLDVGDVASPAAFDAALRAAGGRGWLRVVGYHERGAGPLDRARLDALVPDRPVRVQHATGAAWMLNSPALAAVGIGQPDGWISSVPVVAEPLDLGEVGRSLLAVGVTGVTDATPFDDPTSVALLADAVADGRLPQRLVVTGSPALPAVDRLERGPAKVVLAEPALPTLAELADVIARVHRTGRPVAVHCVTAAELALLLAAWNEVGAEAGDRVEHGAVVGPAAAARLAALGVTVVTQPGFVAERGDRYLAEVDRVDRPHLWPCGSLLRAGVAVGGGTDAPFGRPDPWAAMTAAVHRRTAAGAVLGDDERVPPARALELFLTPLDAPGGPPRRVVVGAQADLCVLDRPLADALAHPAEVTVAATVIDGLLAAQR